MLIWPGAPTILRLPTDRRRPPEQTFDGATFFRTLDAELTEEMRELCTARGVSPYMLLMATFTTLLYRRSGQDDILLGGPMANRDHPGFEHLIGFFANTTVVARAARRQPDVLRPARDRPRLGARAPMSTRRFRSSSSSMPLSPQRDPGVNPLFQVNFRVRVGEPPVLQIPGAETSLVRVEMDLARFDLALELHVTDHDGTIAEFNYNTALWDAATIERLADDFESLLPQVIATPEERLLSFAVSETEPDAPAATAAGGSQAGGIRGFRRETAR